MNLATKMVVGANKGELIKTTWRFCIKPTSSSVYSVIMIKLCQSIPSRFEGKKDI